MLKRFSIFTLLILFTATILHAQKQKLEPEDYGQWQNFAGTDFSPDGSWFAYNIALVDGDGWLTLKKVGTDTTGEHKFMHGVRPEFSEDSKWAAFMIGVSEDKREKLVKQDKPARNKLGLMNLSTAEVDTFPGVSSFEFSDDGKFLAMKKYKPKEVKTNGSDLILRNLESGINRIIGNAADFNFSEDGGYLAVLVDASEKLGNGVYLHRLADNSMRVLDSDTAAYSNLVWHDEEPALAFMKAREDEDFEDETQQLYSFKNITDDEIEKSVFDQRDQSNFPDSMRITDHRDPQWSEDGERLFFGVKKWERKEDKKMEKTAADSSETDSTQADSAKADAAQPDSAKTDSTDTGEDLNADLKPSNVEVWHWKDDDIQPRQELMADNTRRESDLSVWHLDDNKFVQLQDSTYELFQLTGDQKHAVGYDPNPYEPAFEEDWKDVYLVDAATGERKKILTKFEYVRTSPGGNYLLYFKNKNWWTYNIADDEHTNITQDIDKRFENFNSVSGRQNARPFGAGQWAENDDWVILYDQYDAYRVQPNGSESTKLTNGTADKIRYRQTRVHTEENYIEENHPVYFAMYGDTTKNRGYARLDADGDLEELIYEPAMIGSINKAKSADKFVYQSETANDSPDYFYVEENFSDPIALTHTNPQQDEYQWADDELITFTNKRGEQLQGRLLYPTNYEEGKTYPMVTYIYEKRSQTMHSYSGPSRKSPYSFRRFSSEGYFVFQPDITYKLRDPGVSAVESVVPAVEKVLETGMIDKEKLGLTGHSWGAYQTTFIVTQTDLFNSAVAGAPLTNMISMYNSIYWNSGTTDAQIFETSQGRFPDPWWEDRENYVENSPIFNLDSMNTPLLVEFGTDDGAVDFNQGVELYNTMRRMQKPFVMLVYEGENHGLGREENQIDYATRAFEWHEHFLLGEEAADWIDEGLPYLQRPESKEKEKEKEN
jgi:dipeptidyl aminopeptidase/acylaminoacyl peptidase